MVTIKVFDSYRVACIHASTLVQDHGYSRKSQNELFFKHPNNRVICISISQFYNKVIGMNIDAIIFNCSPTNKEEQLAINRTMLKKGIVKCYDFIIYDWSDYGSQDREDN